MPIYAPEVNNPATNMKILFILPNIAVGGVERVRLTLIQQFVADGIECHLALRHCHGELIERARAIAPVHELAPRGMHQFVPELVRLLKREQPTHIITAFSDLGLLTWIARKLSRNSAKWVHSVDNTHNSVAWRRGFWGRLRSRSENRMAAFTYRRADAIVAVSHGIRQEVLDYYHIPPTRIKTIYNPVMDDAELHKIKRPNLTNEIAPKIVALGRLVRQKGFDILVQAMVDVPGQWRLDIWGDGPERTKLKDLICKHGLEAQIHLRGYTSTPLEVMRHADIFVMASRHEGLGNTLIEALACQCQVVATDCPHGPREILNGDALGQLVPVEDSSALATAIIRAMDGSAYVDPKLLLNRAARFSNGESCRQWEGLLRSL